MDKYVTRGKRFIDEVNSSTSAERTFKQTYVDIDLENLPSDPGLRPRISSYHPDVRDKVRRKYLLSGPCQPAEHNFQKKKFGNVTRSFNPAWYDDHKNWLEYSINKEAAFCLCCYLFKSENDKHGGGDSFVMEGFNSWNKPQRFTTHVGKLNSSHSQSVMKCHALMNQKQHLSTYFSRYSDLEKRQYRTRLCASVDYVRFLLRQGLPFRGHDESKKSLNSGNFLELLNFLADHNEDIKKFIGKNAPDNLKMTSHAIQHDIISTCVVETANAIIADLEDGLFTVLVDESRDVSVKEQMIIVIRYVNKKGCIIERFLDIVHISDTTALSLKKGIELTFMKYGLSLSRLRGQGYDGASNMRGEFNGLKSIIMRENESAHYVHCFAHQLQLTLVAVAKNIDHVASLFNVIAMVLNIVGASCRRRDILREKEAARIVKGLENGELVSGRGLNQELGVRRACGTRWGSHYGSLLNLRLMFDSVIKVLDVVAEDGTKSIQRVEANSLLESLQSFDFIFSFHLMKSILGITNELSQTLQRKDENIAGAMTLVKVSKQRLQDLRDTGWSSLILEVSAFCTERQIIVLHMEDIFQPCGRSRRKSFQVTNLHHYQIDIFYAIIDTQLQELNSRFTEINTELLLGVACLSSDESFAVFDKKKLLSLTTFYPRDFSSLDILTLDNQLDNYIADMRSSDEFCDVKRLDILAQKLVETQRDLIYPMVFRLLKLALILPVATTSVERAFSAMNSLKNRLRNKMGDQLLGDCLITYIEKDVFDCIDNEVIMERFQHMSNHRGQL